jgi:pSer/pThr/pTyr-binding forkhead associated (FHA) protein
MISPNSGESFQLKEGTTVIGRETDNEIQIVSDTVSRHHARIENMASVCELHDLESANGSFVNGKKITMRPLTHGDEIRLGDYVFVFEASSGDTFAEEEQSTKDYSDRTRQDTFRFKVHPAARRTLLSPEKPKRPVEPLRPLRPKSDDSGGS